MCFCAVIIVISGWMVEGLVIYDCFVLNEKADAIWYHGGQAVVRSLNVSVADLADGNVKILVNPEAETGNSWYYKLGTATTTVTHGMDVSSWTKLTKNGLTVAKGANTVVTVAEAKSDGKAVAAGTARLA